MGSNPITKAWMLEALSDREWHSQYELINRASRYIKPEVVSKRYYKSTKRKQPTKIDVNLAVYYGTKNLVSRALAQLNARGLVEYRGPTHSDDREIRFIGWYCWNCGRLQSSEKPDHGRCGACPIHCWSCGSIIDDPKCVDDELCARCQKIHDDIANSKEIAKSKFVEEEELQKAVRQEIMSRPTKPRFMSAKTVEEPEQKRETTQRVLEEPDEEGDTIIYHSTVKLKCKRRRTPKPPKQKEVKPKPNQKESKPNKRIRKAKEKVDIKQIEPPKERLLLTYEPDLFKRVDVNALPELMGVTIKH